eukprot:302603-Pleurochrysis_carterae.AAC.7
MGQYVAFCAITQILRIIGHCLSTEPKEVLYFTPSTFLTSRERVALHACSFKLNGGANHIGYADWLQPVLGQIQ